MIQKGGFAIFLCREYRFCVWFYHGWMPKLKIGQNYKNDKNSKNGGVFFTSKLIKNAKNVKKWGFWIFWGPPREKPPQNGASS